MSFEMSDAAKGSPEMDRRVPAAASKHGQMLKTAKCRRRDAPAHLQIISLFCVLAPLRELFSKPISFAAKDQRSPAVLADSASSFG